MIDCGGLDFEAGEILWENRFKIADGDMIVGIILIEWRSLPIGVHNINRTVEKAWNFCKINVVWLLQRRVIHGSYGGVGSSLGRS